MMDAEHRPIPATYDHLPCRLHIQRAVEDAMRRAAGDVRAARRAVEMSSRSAEAAYREAARLQGEYLAAVEQLHRERSRWHAKLWRDVVHVWDFLRIISGR